MDYNMRFEAHVQRIVNKTKYLIYVFRRLRGVVDSKTLAMVYHALFLSNVSYGILAWGGAYDNVMGRIQSVQNRLLRIIYRINDKDFLNVRQLFALESTAFHYNHNSQLYQNKNSRTRTNSITPPKIFKTIYKKNSYYVALRCFNSLPLPLKALSHDSKSKIKTKIQKNSKNMGYKL